MGKVFSKVTILGLISSMLDIKKPPLSNKVERGGKKIKKFLFHN